ncbi:hypothetical protein RvY_15247 [Ramazzottius varieornatus]|uniref:Uncharacterized protein n=1 Tax=Ramazzottius varieornatus TaxID=947166 RepID=A0A1D1VVJ5_RAMVA|nr:hypothetical protein RvY_15247 [Ramazzottius varieornatus]
MIWKRWLMTINVVASPDSTHTQGGWRHRRKNLQADFRLFGHTEGSGARCRSPSLSVRSNQSVPARVYKRTRYPCQRFYHRIHTEESAGREVHNRHRPSRYQTRL